LSRGFGSGGGAWESLRLKGEAQGEQTHAAAFARSIAVWGPGLLVMLADTDAGNVVTAAQAGAQWGYRLLPLVLMLIPMLYMVQELTVRLGLYTGRGHGELIRERFGAVWAYVSTLGLAAAVTGSLITEFTGVAGIGELLGLSRSLTLPMAAATLLVIVASGSYKRVERVALLIGLFELAFFVVAWRAHPGLAALSRDAIDLPIRNSDFLLLVAAVIGATFNPWMIFYQQSATVDKRLEPDDLVHARWDTGVGAILTQCLTGAVLVAAAAAFATGSPTASLTTVGEISGALTPVLGESAGRVVFGAGVLGASLVAAIVSSLALAWGVGEVAGYRRSLEYRPFEAGWFYGVYAACVIGSCAVVWLTSNLIWLNIAAQVLNAFLMPLVIGFLVALAVKALPAAYRLKGWYLVLIVGVSGLVAAVGVFGGLQALLRRD
jgi:Mn2+/Fe2+ NRAMP family transporter